MRARRRRAVYGLMAVVTSGHLFDIATAREHWPFSPYPMYAHAAREWAMVVPRIVGVARDGAEVPLWRDAALAPFDQSRLIQALQAMRPSAEEPSRAGAALRDCLARYERRRVAGDHDGPALRALRYYHLHWTLDPEARNVDRPDRQVLVLEVTADGPAS